MRIFCLNISFVAVGQEEHFCGEVFTHVLKGTILMLKACSAERVLVASPGLHKMCARSYILSDRCQRREHNTDTVFLVGPSRDAFSLRLQCVSNSLLESHLDC